MAKVRYNGGGGTPVTTLPASNITYDNNTSGLTADDVQEAIDEVQSEISNLSYSASDITYNNTASGLTADDVQEAIDEVDGNLDTLDGKVYKTDDSTETTIASDDLLPIYDTSATASKKITVENVVKATVSNPNLIDNPWFTVNQRGFSSNNTLGYTVDRWKNNIGNFTVAISDDIITLTKSSDTTTSEFVQYFELSRLSACVGKYITLSVMLSDGSIYKGSGIMPTLTSSLQWFIEFSIGDNFSAGCGVRTTNNCLVRIKSNIASATLSIKAVKLEVGSVSTLALDTAPNYATELLKCQRYFYRMNTENGIFQVIGTGRASTETLVEITVKLATTMRSNPSVSINGDITDIRLCGNGVTALTSAYLGTRFYGDYKKILFTTSVNLTVNELFLAEVASTAETDKTYIDFTADL